MAIKITAALAALVCMYVCMYYICTYVYINVPRMLCGRVGTGISYHSDRHGRDHASMAFC